MEIIDWVQGLDFAGVAVFAATGALAASRRQLDVIGFVFLASFTGVGGGTLRDIILGQVPVFWIKQPSYLLVCSGVAIVVYFTAHLLESRYRALLWFDAIGLAVFSVVGAKIGYAASDSATIAIVTGVTTATFGGIIRDVISGQPSVIMRPQIYVTAALAGSAGYVAAIALGVSTFVSMLVAVLLAFIIRGSAIRFDWRMPTYRAKEGRSEQELQDQGMVSQNEKVPTKRE